MLVLELMTCGISHLPSLKAGRLRTEVAVMLSSRRRDARSARAGESMVRDKAAGWSTLPRRADICVELRAQLLKDP